jgi:two-component system, chemotaxis family, response regulator Rcp1
MHLLLVEDNPGDVGLVRMALAPFLAQGTLQLSTVTQGDEALAFLLHHAPYTQGAAPDVVLLDLNLPGKSGYEVLAELKQDPALRSIPVVVLTTTQNAQDINRCYELGASAYLVKPLELEQYLSVVKITAAFWSTCKLRTLKD